MKKKTPSALKWLAETRARVSYELAESERVWLAMLERTRKLREELAAVDRTLTIYDPSLCPADIQPVNGHRPEYGSRGGLTAAITHILKSQAPHYVSTELLLEHFQDWLQRNRTNSASWVLHPTLPQLKLVDQAGYYSGPNFNEFSLRALDPKADCIPETQVRAAFSRIGVKGFVPLQFFHSDQPPTIMRRILRVAEKPRQLDLWFDRGCLVSLSLKMGAES